MSLLSSVVNGIADLAGMSGQAHYQRRNMRESARLQHEENQFWADYNTPANQMARLKAAGLNPNLVYGNGADAQFQGSISPSGGMPSYKGGYGTDYLTHSNMLAQNQNLKAQNDLLSAQTQKELNTAESIAIDNLIKRSGNPNEEGVLRLQLLRQQVKNEREKGLQMQADRLLKRTEEVYKSQMSSLLAKYGDTRQAAELNNINFKNAILYVQAQNMPENIAADLKIKGKQAENLAAHTAELGALKSYYNQLKQNAKSENDKIILQSLGQIIENGMKSLEYEFKDYRNGTLNGYRQFLDSYVNPTLQSLNGLLNSVTNMEEIGSVIPY